MIVCDGRGSAELSHYGAQEAVKAFRSQIAVMEPFLKGILDCEEKKEEQWLKVCRIMYRTLMQAKYDLSERYGKPEKEFDFTVVFAIAGEQHIGCFQVGDGALVLRQNDVCMTAFKPDKGEFANQTSFLKAGGEERGSFQSAMFNAKENSGIAASSDGPEYLMFRLQDMMPGPIFNEFFNDLKNGILCKQHIMDYLTRPEWSRDPRGTDDRSLALLVNSDYTEPLSEPKPDATNTDPDEKYPDVIEQSPVTNQPLTTVEKKELTPIIRLKALTIKIVKNARIILLTIPAVLGIWYGFNRNARYEQTLTDYENAKRDNTLYRSELERIKHELNATQSLLKETKQINQILKIKLRRNHR